MHLDYYVVPADRSIRTSIAISEWVSIFLRTLNPAVWIFSFGSATDAINYIQAMLALPTKDAVRLKDAGSTRSVNCGRNIDFDERTGHNQGWDAD